MAKSLAIEPADALKRAATKTTISSSSTNVTTLAASKAKLVEADKPAVVISEKAVRDSVVSASLATGKATEKSTATAFEAATLSGKKTITGKVISQDSLPNSGMVISPMVETTPSIAKSTSDKADSLLDAAIRDSEEEMLKQQKKEEAASQEQLLMYELMQSASQGDQREDLTIDPKEVDLDEMKQEAAAAEAERIINGQEVNPEDADPANKPSDDQPVEEAKWYVRLWNENKTAVICCALAVLALVIVVAKKK